MDHDNLSERLLKILLLKEIVRTANGNTGKAPASSISWRCVSILHFYLWICLIMYSKLQFNKKSHACEVKGTLIIVQLDVCQDRVCVYSDTLAHTKRWAFEGIQHTSIKMNNCRPMCFSSALNLKSYYLNQKLSTSFQ